MGTSIMIIITAVILIMDFVLLSRVREISRQIEREKVMRRALGRRIENRMTAQAGRRRHGYKTKVQAYSSDLYGSGRTSDV